MKTKKVTKQSPLEQYFGPRETFAFKTTSLKIVFTEKEALELKKDSDKLVARQSMRKNWRHFPKYSAVA